MTDTTLTTYTTYTPWSFVRRFVVAVAAALVAIVWTHALAAVLRGDDAPLTAVPLTLAAVAVAVIGAAALPRRYAAFEAAGAGAAAAAMIEAFYSGAWPATLALPIVGAAVTVGAGWLGRRLPESLDDVLTRQSGAAIAWALLSLVAVAQVGRLTTFMTDRTFDFVLTTRNPFWYGHECLPAYLYGAEMAARGEENIYHASHYPALDPQAEPRTSLTMTVEDPYQYPPQFLLLPRLALVFSDDVTTLRLIWFALQFSLFAAAFAALAHWIGYRRGRLALWLLPAALAAFPMLHNFQFGQFHLSAVALAVLAMLAFTARRHAGGGMLLAIAILAKLFPAILLVPLAMRRRWRELAWTGAWGVALTVLALVVLGPAPFHAFFDYHLPRLGSGEAFAFDEAWPELTDLVIADNQGAFGLAMKLGFDKPTASRFGRLFGLAVLVIAISTARRAGRRSRDDTAAVWLALLGAASLTSPGAWGDYVPSVAIWLLAVIAVRTLEDRRWIAPLAVTAVFQFFLLGTMPLGSWAPPEVMVPVSTLGVLSLISLYGWVLWGDPARLRRPEALPAEAAGALPADGRGL